MSYLVHRIPDFRVRKVELHLEILEVALGGVYQLEGDVALAGGLDRKDVLVGTTNTNTNNNHKSIQTRARSTANKKKKKAKKHNRKGKKGRWCSPFSEEQKRTFTTLLCTCAVMHVVCKSLFCAFFATPLAPAPKGAPVSRLLMNSRVPGSGIVRARGDRTRGHPRGTRRKGFPA